MPDLIVIGGGPAGSTAATLLARRGFETLVLERDYFPREHIGESLLPASMPLLAELGVLEEMEEAGFLRKHGATMVWGTSREPWSWYFRETNVRFPHAYQVWRAEFDRRLLENAARAGAEVREGCRVLEVSFEGDRATGVAFRAPDGTEHRVSARYVIDASGQAGMLARSRRLRSVDERFRNLAVYAYFERASRLPEPDSTNIFIESFEHGWFWNIPLHTGWMSVGAVVDSAFGQSGIAEAGAEPFLRRQIARAPRTAAMLAEARMVSGPTVLRDWSYVSREVAGDGWAICGDAACFIDPLFSTGVHLALSSGMMASALAAAVLTDPPLGTAAAPVYKELYFQQYSHFRELAGLFYASNRSVESYFWEVRRVLEDDSLTPREAFVRATAGQSAKGYERVVLERGELPEGFAREVAALEQAHSQRAEEVGRAIASGAILRARPRAAEGTTVEMRPVLAGTAFAWGQVLSSPARPEGIEVSDFVVRLVELSDGERDVAALITELGAGHTDERLLSTALRAIQVLYTDGLLEMAFD